MCGNVTIHFNYFTQMKAVIQFSCNKFQNEEKKLLSICNIATHTYSLDDLFVLCDTNVDLCEHTSS